MANSKSMTSSILFSAVLLILGTTFCAYGETKPQTGKRSSEAQPERKFQAIFDGAFLYGPIDGSLQTPSGGTPGSTSSERPKLDELGIETASIGDLSLILGWTEHEIYLGVQLVRLSGESVLDEGLMSQGNYFPAGSSVESDVKLDWYRVGYRYRLFWMKKGEKPLLVLFPSVGFALWNFSFELDGPSMASVDRSYAKGSAQLGIGLDWILTQRVSINGQLLGSLPLPSTPIIVMGEAVAKYKLVERRNLSLGGFLGVSYESIYYEDDQTVPNDIEVSIGPMLTIGFELSF